MSAKPLKTASRMEDADKPSPINNSLERDMDREQLRKVELELQSARDNVQQVQQELLLERVEHSRTQQRLNEALESALSWQEQAKTIHAELVQTRSAEPQVVVVRTTWMNSIVRALVWSALGVAGGFFFAKHAQELKKMN